MLTQEEKANAISAGSVLQFAHDLSFSLLNSSKAFSRSWQNAQELPPTAPKNRPSMVRPSSSATKCISDASWNAAREDVVWVGFLRMHLRTLVLGSALLTACLVGSVLVAEALAVKAAMSAAISLGHQKLECFSDSKGLVSLLVNKGSAVEIKAISHDIWCPTGAFNISYNFQKIHRLPGCADQAHLRRVPLFFIKFLLTFRALNF